MECKLPVFNIERFAIHDGPGIRTVVFLQGCPLRCAWCANPESQTVGTKIFHLSSRCVGCGACIEACTNEAISIQEGKTCIDRSKCTGCGKCASVCPQDCMQPSGKWMMPEEVEREALKDLSYYENSGGGVTFSGGEALLHFERLRPLTGRLRGRGIHIAMETCGQVDAKVFRNAVEEFDLFLFDVKTLDQEKMDRFVGGSVTMILDNLSFLAERHPEKVIVRIPVIPGFNFDDAEVHEIFRLLGNLRLKKVELLPYHTLGKIKYGQLGMKYPFGEQKALMREQLTGFQALGQSLGLHVGL